MCFSNLSCLQALHPEISFNIVVCCFLGGKEVNVSTFASNNTRAANEYSSLGVRGDLGLYSSPS